MTTQGQNVGRPVDSGWPGSWPCYPNIKTDNITAVITLCCLEKGGISWVYFFVPIPQFLAKNLLYEKEGDIDCIALDDEASADT